MATRRKRTPRKTQTKNGEEESAAEFAILFPFKEVELSTGEKVVVKQWDIDTGAVLTTRVVTLMQKLAKANVSGTVEPHELIAIAKDECLEIVAQTLGWTVDELREKVPFEDFLTLLDVVANQNLARDDGGGAIPKFVGLAGSLVPLAGLGRVTSAPPPPSTSSSEPDTPSPTSGE